MPFVVNRRLQVNRFLSVFRDERGQTTAEYALVLLVVGVVVGVFVALIKSGALDGFFTSVIERLDDNVG